MITAKPRSPVFRGSAIALSIVAALFWGGVLLTASGNALLRIDVALAATFSGLHSESNLLYFASSDPAFAGKGFLVAQGCSSLHGMSIAILAFVLVTQFYNLPAKPATVVWGLLGVAATIAVNIARLSIMGHFPAYYEWVHLGPGAVIAGMVGMILVLLANLGGNWRAITRNG